MRSRESDHVDGCGHLPQNAGHLLSDLLTESQVRVSENKIRLHDKESQLMFFRKTDDSVYKNLRNAVLRNVEL